MSKTAKAWDGLRGMVDPSYHNHLMMYCSACIGDADMHRCCHFGCFGCDCRFEFVI